MILNGSAPRPLLGWPLLPYPDEAGQLAFPSLADSIRQNLRVILSTRASEQLMHPEYGAGLTDFIGEADTLTTRRRIYDRINDAIARWETRIDLNRINVDELPQHPGDLRIEIAYRIRRTGESATLGLNLDLDS